MIDSEQAVWWVMVCSVLAGCAVSVLAEALSRGVLKRYRFVSWRSAPWGTRHWRIVPTDPVDLDPVHRTDAYSENRATQIGPWSWLGHSENPTE